MRSRSRLLVRHLVELQVAGGQLQRPGGHVDRRDVLDARVREQVPGEHARAAAEVADPAGAAFAEDGEDGLAALDRQRLVFVFVLGDRVVEFGGVGVVGFGQPGERGPGELALV